MTRRQVRPLSRLLDAQVEQDVQLVKGVIKAALGGDPSRERRRCDELDAEIARLRKGRS